MDAKQQAATQLAIWLYNTHPDLFLAAYHKAAFGATPQTKGLGDVSDFLSSIGTNVSDAVSSVGSWLTTGGGLNSMAALGTAVLNNQTQQNVLNTQLARVQTAQAPLAIGYAQNAQGQIVPVLPVSSAGTPVTYSASTPQVASYLTATPAVLSQYTPSFFAQLQQYLPWILGGGALLVGISLFRRSRA